MQSQGLTMAIYSRHIARFQHVCIIGIVLLANPAIADQLSDLSEADQAAIARLCLPVQYKEGASAYRQCVLDEVGIRGDQEPSATNALSFDEQYAIQQFCQANSDSAQSSNQQCVNQQLEGLDQIPQIQLDSFDGDELYAVQQSCFEIQNTGGVKAYRQCINETAAELLSLPKPDLSALSLLERNALQLNCSAQHAAASDYRQCLLAAVGESTTALANPANTVSSDDVTSLEPVTESVETTTDSTPAAETFTASIEEPEINPAAVTQTADMVEQNASVAESSTAVSGDVLTTIETPSAFAINETGNEAADIAPKGIWEQAQTSVSGLNNTGRIILTAAMALPILLIGFWFLMRGGPRQPEYGYHSQGERNPLIDRVKPSLQQQEQAVRDFEDTMDHTDHTDQLNLSRQADDMFGEMPPHESDAATPVNVNPHTHSLDQLGSMERAGFLAWLNQHAADTRQSLAIEFLIYWLAYGDDRYEPAMKAAIFRMQAPDEHEQIKRWVLLQDIYAFSDVVYWLQHNATATQKTQILDLLMALLINENALTPVQNTALRFLGDAFGLGHEGLDTRFRQAFGHSMPPLPRVDKPRWWDRQAEDQRKRWDARTVSIQSRDFQYRVKLGLPLRGEVVEEDVAASFNRAASRCHPHRFNELGPREQSLAQGQLEKFAFAKDSLLEVSV